MANALFIDTWGWIAIGNRQEPRRSEVIRFYQECRARRVRMYTSDYVLTELITLLFTRETYSHSVAFIEGLLAGVGDQIQLVRVTSERFMGAWELRKRYHDKPRISFTDLTSMVIMDELAIQQVLTEDEHFSHVGKGFIRVPQ